MLAVAITTIASISFSIHAGASEQERHVKTLNEKNLSSDHIQFQSSVQALLDSVKSRDFSTFEKFFNRDLEFKAVLPGGKVFNDIPSFMASQADWFKGSTGNFDFELDRTELSGDLGAAFANVIYKNIDAKGESFSLEIYISFLFRRIGHQWFLTHDQNSVLKESR